MDMSIYTAWAGYGFLILIALAFVYFLPHLSFKPAENQPAVTEKAVRHAIAPAGIPADVLPVFRLVNYSVISIIILNITILLLLIIF